MKIKISSYDYSFLFFLVSYPLSFLYSYALVSGLAPKIPFLGYALITHAFLPGIFFISIYFFKKTIDYKYYTVFIIFILYTIFYSLLGTIFIKNSYSTEALYQSLWFIIYFYAFSVMAIKMYPIPLRSAKILLFLLTLFFIIVAMNFKLGSGIFFSLGSISETDDQNINYQRVSFIFLITWFFFYYSSHYPRLKVLSVAVILFLLFSSGGRSELFGFIFAFSYLTFLNMKVRLTKKIIWLFVVSILILIFSSLFGLQSTLDSLGSSRHTEVSNLSESSSWQARELLFRDNIGFVIENPVLGAFGSHFEIARGAYIHNILSSWQQYGLVGFSLYLSLLLIPFIHLTYLKLFKKNIIFIDPTLFIISYSFILVLFAKSVFWQDLGIACGTYIAFTFYRSLKKTSLLHVNYQSEEKVKNEESSNH